MGGILILALDGVYKSCSYNRVTISRSCHFFSRPFLHYIFLYPTCCNHFLTPIKEEVCTACHAKLKLPKNKNVTQKYYYDIVFKYGVSSTHRGRNLKMEITSQFFLEDHIF